VLRYVDVPAWDAPQAWVYVTVMGSFVVSGIWGDGALRETRPHGDSYPNKGTHAALAAVESDSGSIDASA